MAKLVNLLVKDGPEKGFWRNQSTVGSGLNFLVSSKKYLLCNYKDAIVIL